MGQWLRVRTATMAPPLAQCMSGFVFGSGFRSFFAIFEPNKDTQNTQTHRKPKYLDWNDQKYILTEVSFRSLGKESVLFVHCPLLSSLFHMHSGRRRLTKISDWNSAKVCLGKMGGRSTDAVGEAIGDTFFFSAYSRRCYLCWHCPMLAAMKGVHTVFSPMCKLSIGPKKDHTSNSYSNICNKYVI